ncbi:hypothetical protein R1sor_016946 [Riccia sorocarpa]|uniref:Phosphoglycerate mutase-like protein n=1 Tax=Riccia sorocarpa TaxID=122646 RepID=A0ABD3I8S5_9MARC
MLNSRSLQNLLQVSGSGVIRIRPTFTPTSARLLLVEQNIAFSLPVLKHRGLRFSKLRTGGLHIHCSRWEGNGMTGDVTLAAAYPLQRSKNIYLVRHGQGFHNVAGEMDFGAYMSPEFFDASLTSRGWQQVAALRNHVRSNGVASSLQLVVVSPLTRTLQTAVGVFGGDDILNGNSTETPLMIDGVGKDKHKAVSSVGAPPFVAVEWCREHMGLHPCDQREPIRTYRSLFPAIDFSDVESDEDILWSATVRESQEDLIGRAKNFVKWILKRRETEIAVVSHSGFLRHLMSTFGDDCSSKVQSELHKYFQNCEMRSIVLVDKRAEEESKVPTKDFPGGIPSGADAPSDSVEV